jgi:hypothetical protein
MKDDRIDVGGRGGSDCDWVTVPVYRLLARALALALALSQVFSRSSPVHSFSVVYPGRYRTKARAFCTKQDRIEIVMFSHLKKTCIYVSDESSHRCFLGVFAGKRAKKTRIPIP